MLNDEEINYFRQLLEHRLAETRNALQATVTETVTLDQTRLGRLSRTAAFLAETPPELFQNDV